MEELSEHENNVWEKSLYLRETKFNVMLMSTKTESKNEELQLDSKRVDSYAPEQETSIWYN